MFQMFHLVFQTYVCKCFCLDVAYVFTHMKCFHVFFASISYTCFDCFSYFIGILQVFHFDV
jgi:hypothetical protein